MNIHIPKKKYEKSKSPSNLDQKKKYELEHFIEKRDFTGAVTLLNFQKKNKETNPLTLNWLAYCYFHIGEYTNALEIYDEILENQEADPVNWLYRACCLYQLEQFEESEESALKGPNTRLQNRILLHCAHKKADETQLLQYHNKVKASNSTEDQLSLAAIHFIISNYADAVDIYNNERIKNRDYLALHYYLALCCFCHHIVDITEDYEKCLYYVDSYLSSYPDSVCGINLKAACIFRLSGGPLAEQIVKTIIEQQDQNSQTNENVLLKHNMVCFRDGENALQVLPPLIDIVVPEARLNLVIYHLKHNNYAEAYNLVKDYEHTTAQGLILKGFACAVYGQTIDSIEHIQIGDALLSEFGNNESEKNTIPGRQCMASCFFLRNEFQHVIHYFRSIGDFMNDDAFFWNFAISLAMCGEYKEALAHFLSIRSEEYIKDNLFLCWLCHIYIMNGNAKEAWDIYLRVKNIEFLPIIANDCYKYGSFFYAAKAFDVLERLDDNPEFSLGKRGACCGVFQQIYTGNEKPELIIDILQILDSSDSFEDKEILSIISQWCSQNGIMI